MMNPIDYYTVLRRRQEELLRQATYERMVRAAKNERAPCHQFHRQLAAWLGLYLMIVGQKLERYGAPARMRQTPHASQHH